VEELESAVAMSNGKDFRLRNTIAPRRRDAHWRWTRRSFLKATTAATLAAPTIVPASVFGATAPSNRIALGCIGVGNKGIDILRKFIRFRDCQVVAVCDVNRGSHGYRDDDQCLGREPVQREVERFYASELSSGSYKGCAAYVDFRELLARGDIDAVTVCTPDHWHAPITIRAAEAGKDMYCEKPLSLTIGDGRAMVDAVRRHGRVLQTGSHERSNPTIRFACELVRNGYLGDVKRVVTHVGRHNKVGPGPGWTPMPVPDGFDYDMWLGPAPMAPYHQDRCLYRFRFNYDYSGGQVTNFGAHSIDIAQWALGRDASGPVRVEHVYAEFLPEGSLFNVTTYSDFRCEYDDGIVLECVTAEPAVRCVFEGTEGMLRIDAKGNNFVTIPQRIKRARLGPDDVRLGTSTDHQRDFLDAVKSRGEPSAPVEVGHRSATVCHLGNISLRLKAQLNWDPQAERFVGQRGDEANTMIHRSGRSPWNVAEQVVASRPFYPSTEGEISLLNR
jgi:predicted dehydrogenase